jgi:peptide/nickel transport system permease protein
LFLVIPPTDINDAAQGSSWFFGTTNNNQFIPIRSYKINQDSIFIERYVDEDTAVSESYALMMITNGHPENWKNQLVTKKFLLGTDGFGRDMLSRMIIGSRVSLSVGFIAVLVSLLIGIFLGSLGGYYRGRTDAFIVWLIQVMWSMPTLLLVFAFTIIMGKGYWQIFIAVGLTMWVNVARLVRGQVMAMKNKTFVEAARVMGFSDWRIITKHILPNIMGPILVIAASNFAAAIMIEAGLSFLGFGVQPPEPSWGGMIKENFSFILTNKPFLAIIPGLAIMALVTAFYLLGNGLRDALDVKTNL